MTSSFAIRFGIDTPIVLRDLLHFDGLLGSLLFAQNRSLNELPLIEMFGVWQGSAAILETGPFGFMQSNIARLKRVQISSMPSGLFDHLEPNARKIGQMSPMRNQMNVYTCFEGVRAVWFIGRGDYDSTVDLLYDVRNLGAMGKTGYGRVTSIDMVELEENRLTAVATRAGMPLRTIALSDWDRIGVRRPDSSIVSLQRYRPPYWTGVKTPCISPMQIDLCGTSSEINFLIHGS
jgi:hypothetical protein